MKKRWNEFIYFMGYLLLILAFWMVLFGGSIKLGHPFEL